MFTARVTTRVRGTQRVTKQFVRDEFAANTPYGARQFDTLVEATQAGNAVADRFRESGDMVVAVETFRDGMFPYSTQAMAQGKGGLR